jgi:hypothetical protein
MVVPLLSGGGTRIKILEAFSRLCPVVATPVGAHGIEVTGGKHLLLPMSRAFCRAMPGPVEPS